MNEICCGKNSVLNLEKKEIINCFIDGKDKKIINHFKMLGINYQIVSQSALDKMSKSENHQGVVCEIKPYSYVSLNKLLQKEELIIFLDGVTDSHNLGAIIRSMSCAGVSSLVLPRRNSCFINSGVRKVASGAVRDVEVAIVENLKSAINEAKQQDYNIYSTGLMDASDYKMISYPKKLVLIMGSENEGVSKSLNKLCDKTIKIPIRGTIDSLNVAVACGILLYEITNS